MERALQYLVVDAARLPEPARTDARRIRCSTTGRSRKRTLDLPFRRTACRRRGRIEGGEIGRMSELVGKNTADQRARERRATLFSPTPEN
jgi:hypothetical protein